MEGSLPAACQGQARRKAWVDGAFAFSNGSDSLCISSATGGSIFKTVLICDITLLKSSLIAAVL